MDRVGTSRIYTRTGDDGTSSLFNGKRAAKDDARFEALGDIDELNAQMGLVVYLSFDEGQNIRNDLFPQWKELMKPLMSQQHRLFDLGAHVATPSATGTTASKLKRTRFDEDGSAVSELERAIDEMDAKLPPLRTFILPSGGPTACHLHIARTICRRAERHVVALQSKQETDTDNDGESDGKSNGESDGAVLRYLNRLSDFLFVAARTAAMLSRRPETTWSPHRTHDPSPKPTTIAKPDTKQAQAQRRVVPLAPDHKAEEEQPGLSRQNDCPDRFTVPDHSSVPDRSTAGEAPAAKLRSSVVLLSTAGEPAVSSSVPFGGSDMLPSDGSVVYLAPSGPAYIGPIVRFFENKDEASIRVPKDMVASGLAVTCETPHPGLKLAFLHNGRPTDLQLTLPFSTNNSKGPSTITASGHNLILKAGDLFHLQLAQINTQHPPGPANKHPSVPPGPVTIFVTLCLRTETRSFFR